MQKNPEVPAQFWIKHSWADPSENMCSPQEWESFITTYKLEHIRDEIAPWFCTAFPTDPYERRYFSIEFSGDVYVSRTKAQRKPIYIKRHKPDESDRCLICEKLLISTFHVFLPVYKWQPNPPKTLIWQWHQSSDKICLIHFYRKDVSYTPERNPFTLSKNQDTQGNRQNENQTLKKKINPETIIIPDEY